MTRVRGTRLSGQGVSIDKLCTLCLVGIHVYGTYHMDTRNTLHIFLITSYKTWCVILICFLNGTFQAQNKMNKKGKAGVRGV